MKPIALAGIILVWLIIGTAGWLVVMTDTDDAHLTNSVSTSEDPVDETAEKPEIPALDKPTDESVLPPTVASEHAVEPPLLKPVHETTADPATVIDSSKPIVLENEAVLDSVNIRDKGTLTLDSGTVTVAYDFMTSSPVAAANTTLKLTGTGEISGKVGVNKLEVTTGTRTFTNGANVYSTRRGNAAPGQEGFYVAAGATVIIEEGATITTSAAYGFRIDGTLIINGGTFKCTFSNGNGKTTNRTWGESSRLEINSGAFVASGDTSFKGTSISMTGGKIQVSDDLWDTGSSLVMSGGSIENSNWGGQFGLSGNVSLSGGELLVHGNSSRGLRIYKDANVSAGGGKIVLFGGSVLFSSTAALSEVEIQGSCHVHKSTDKQTSLYINGGMTFVKGTSFNTAGYNVIVAGMNADNGVFKPAEYQIVKPRANSQKIRFERGSFENLKDVEAKIGSGKSGSPVRRVRR